MTLFPLFTSIFRSENDCRRWSPACGECDSLPARECGGAGSSGLVIGQSNYVLLVDLEAGRELLSRSSTIAVEIIGIASFWKKTQRNSPRRLVPRPFPEAWFPFWFRASGTSVPRVQRWSLRIFPKKKPGNPGKETGLPRLSEDASAVMLREPRRTPERLGDHLFPKKKPRPQPGLSIAG
jgi:hypothetical protein